jgi:hypothetical protein
MRADRRVDRAARLRAAVRTRWDRLDWSAAIPRDAFVIPESHYLGAPPLGLDEDQRVALNRLLACFTCELFVHFEGYVIGYLERHAPRIPALSQALVDRFVAEERVHCEMFRRLLVALRPDLYPTPDAPLRFLRWGRRDDLIVRVAPPGTFFLLAWLFEEITLFVPRIMAATPDQSSALVAAVMHLHAEDEGPHVAIDEQMMTYLGQRGRMWWDGAVVLPILHYIDGKAKRAQHAMADVATAELGLTADQRARLLARGPSQSDRMGMQSFVDKLADRDVAGTQLLRWILRRELASER